MPVSKWGPAVSMVTVWRSPSPVGRATRSFSNEEAWRIIIFVEISLMNPCKTNRKSGSYRFFSFFFFFFAQMVTRRLGALRIYWTSLSLLVVCQFSFFNPMNRTKSVETSCCCCTWKQGRAPRGATKHSLFRFLEPNLCSAGGKVLAQDLHHIRAKRIWKHLFLLICSDPQLCKMTGCELPTMGKCKLIHYLLWIRPH